ncbi:MAG: hypothetical protein N3D10_04260, partial [Candidatus Micrarchaeota archaeon]|nr:hypothetical protein [Candidatus Micrarchaeota archaeon]
GWYIAAFTYYNAEEYDQGLAAIAKAAELEPERKEIWVLGGYLLLATRQYKESKQAFEYVLNLDENNFEANFGLFINAIIGGEEQKAKEYFYKLNELNKPLNAKMLQHFYENFYEKSKTISKEQKEDLEVLIKKMLIEH